MIQRLAALVASVVLLLASLADAQFAQRTLAQPITTAGTDCSTPTSCVVLADVLRTTGGAVGITSSTPTTNFTVAFEGSTDCATWYPLLLTPLAGASLITPAVTTAGGPGAWTWAVALCAVRVRASTLSAGTIAVSIIAR